MASRGRQQRPAILDRLMENLEAQLGLVGEDGIFLESFDIRAKHKVHMNISTREGPLVLKVPLEVTSRRGTVRNWRMLGILRRRGGLEAPAPIASGTINGLQYFAESRLDGDVSVDTGLERPRCSLADIERLLEGINPRLEAEAPVALVGPRFEALVQRPLDRTLTVVTDRCTAQEMRRVARECLHGLRYRQGIVHGDLSWSNLLWRGMRPVGLIDWEQALMTGIPALDAMDHLIARRRARDQSSFAEALLSLYGGAWDDADESRFLERQMLRSGVDPARARDLVLLYWLRYIAPQVEDGTIWRRGGVDKRVTAILVPVLSSRRAHGVGTAGGVAELTPGY